MTFESGATRASRIFAFVASLIMIVVIFQVMAKPGSASPDLIPENEFVESVVQDSDLIEENGTSAESMAQPLIDSPPEGSVEGFSDGIYKTYSDAGEAIARPLLIQEGDIVSIRAHSGTYALNVTHPESLALLDHEGRILVEESYFIVKSQDIETLPVNGIIVKAADDMIVLEYDLADAHDEESVVARMQVTVDFTRLTSPKITASLTQISSDLLDWQIAWIVVPVEDSRILRDAADGAPLHIEILPECQIPTANLSVQLTDSQLNGYAVDWSDARDGILAVRAAKTITGEYARVLEVSFSSGKEEIDPTLVATTTGTVPTENVGQRKVVNYGGYYWAFYYRGDTICYKKSPDGISWGAEEVLPEGTTITNDDSGSTTGFDVSLRDGVIAVVWEYKTTTYPYLHLYIKKGTILEGKIVWSSRVEMYSPNCESSPSVAIGTDGKIWIAALSRLATTQQYYVWYSTTGTSWTVATSYTTYRGSVPHWFTLMPLANGYMALLVTWYADGTATDEYAYVSYGSWMGWTTPRLITTLDMNAGPKGSIISAVASMDGTIHAVYKDATDSRAKYARITETGQSTWYVTSSTISGYPTVCLDANGDVHTYYLTIESTLYVIRHSINWGTNYNEWTTPDVLYTASSGVVLKGLTSWAYPFGSNALLWTENNNQVKFGSIPLPYGTPGAATQPWNRDGISPYGTYFSSLGDLVSPGSGLLNLIQTDVSIESRGAPSFDATRIYQQPRYFKLDGQPYQSGAYPYCNLGPGWSLDLPWMDSQYVYVGGGQRFVINWGNTGVISEFENHDGVHFFMHGFTHGYQYYELALSDGLRYIFLASTKKLVSIADSQGYTSANPLYGENVITLSHDAVTGYLTELRDPAYRKITFAYNANGNLQTITRPDGKTITFAYTSLGGYYRLTSVTDPLLRITTYGYTGYGSPSCYLLTSTTFPSGAKNVYTYTQDTSVGTEVKSYLVTTQKTQDASTSALIRQTDYAYKTMNGRVLSVSLTQKDSAGIVKGYTDYIFSSELAQSTEMTRDSSGVRMQRVDTWYDSAGQPVRVDTFKGTSSSASYTEYTGYDDWGNVIFTRDALDHEAYASYANTKTQNSFQGGGLLDRVSTGKVFHDSFDDWNISDWGTSLTAGNTVALDTQSPDPENMPALKISHNVVGAAVASNTFDDQTSDFIIQTSFMTSSTAPTYIEGKYASSYSNRRFCFYSLSGTFNWWNEAGRHIIGEVTCVSNTWYDIAFYIHYATNTYDIYIDGEKVALDLQPTLVGTSGYIDMIYLQAGDTSSGVTFEWIDNVRIYKSLDVTVGEASGYALELYDAEGELLDRSTSGTLTVSPMPMNFPSGYIKAYKIGFQSFQTPVMDIWGGDAYTLVAGTSDSSLRKTSTGFNRDYSSGRVADDSWPTGATSISYNDDSDPWVDDADYAMSGPSYHLNRQAGGSHYHGWYGVSTIYVSTASYTLSQYVWLTEGKVPREIMIQYQISGLWYRAYWGGDYDGTSLMDTGTYVPTSSTKIGDIPQVTEKWLQLVFMPAVSGYITGIIYGAYDMTARWDVTMRQLTYSQVTGLQTGMSVNFESDDGISVSGTASTTYVNLYLCGAGIHVFPVSGTLEVRGDNGATLLYKAPWVEEVYNYDTYTYSAPKSYANDVTDFVHNRIVGSFQHQDYAKTVPQETYFKLDTYGNMIESKSGSGTSWSYSQRGYDVYGNTLWTTDQTGRGSVTEYSIADYNTYPKSVRTGLRVDTFDTDNSWTPTDGYTWMSCTYSDDMSYSGDESIKAQFSGAPSGSDTAVELSIKKYAYVQPVQELSIWMYLDSWYHAGIFPDKLNTGIRMRLYDSAGTNYATYTYWLACWYENTDNWTAPDSYTKLVFGIGDLPVDTWKNVILQPTTDWPTITWSSCANIGFELFVYSSFAVDDYMTLYYDNFAFNDFAKNAKTTFVYDKPTGHLLSSTDPLGRTTSQQFDAIGRIIRENNSDSTYRRTVYDDALNTATVYDELSHKWINYYDRVGRLTRADRCGLLSTTYYSNELYTYAWDDNTLTYTNPLGYTTSYSYDFLGRLTKTTYPDANHSHVTYTDTTNTVTYEDENGHKVAFVYNHLGRLITTREYYTTSSYYTTSVAYDAVGNLLSVTDGRLKTTTMTYDSMNRLERTAYPDGYDENASYDAAGRVIYKESRANEGTRTTYNTAGMVTKIASPDDTIAMTYDSAGRILTKSNSGGTITYVYDARGRVQSQTQVISGLSYGMSFTYDNEGKTTSVTYPNAVVINYQYDSYDRVQYVKQGTTTTLQSETYNKDDSISRDVTSGTQTTDYTYTNRGWVDTIIMKVGTKVKMSLDYGYDAVGNILSINTESYTYDYLNRLKTASGPWGDISYVYDAVGNRISVTDDGVYTSYVHDSYNKLTSSSDGTTYNYDADGNMQGRDIANSLTIDMYYNSLGQMTSYYEDTYNTRKETWSSVEDQTYSYDANGARVKLYSYVYATATATTTYFVYLGHNPYYEKTGTILTDHVYANGRLVAKIVGADVYFYISDALGGTRQVWQLGNTKGAVSSVASYEPFGIPYSVKGTETVLFAGELYNSGSGLYYIGARYMDPALGRWTSLDPELGSISAPQTMNRYVYCINNPLRVTDPTGKLINLIAAAVGAVTGLVVSTVLYGLEVALTDKEWDWGEYAVEAAAGAIGGAIGGLLLNPGVGLAARAGMKASLMGAKVAAKIGQKTVERAVGGAIAGAFTGPVKYSLKSGMMAAMGRDSGFSLKGLGESSLFGAIGGAAGSVVGGKFGDWTGKYINTIAGRLNLMSYMEQSELEGSIIGSSVASKLTSGLIDKVRNSLNPTENLIPSASYLPMVSG